MLSDVLRNRFLKTVRMTARKAARAAKHAARGSSMLWQRTERHGRVTKKRAWQSTRVVRRASRRLVRQLTTAVTTAQFLTGAAVDFVRRVTRCPGCRHTGLESFGIEIGKSRWRGRVPRRTWLLGCRSCGLLFTSYRPNPAELDAYYDGDGEWSQRQQSRQRTGTAFVANALFEVIAGVLPLRHPRGDAAVLDVGCGDGTWLNSLHQHGWDTYGVEPSTKIAFRKHHELTEIPQNATFDLVILHHVLEHVQDPMGLLAMARGALRHDGALFVSVPHLNALPAHRAFKYCINGTSHLQAFTVECLTVLLLNAGFSRVASVRDTRLDSLTSHPDLRLRMIAWCAPSSPGASADVPPPDPLAAATTALRQAGVVQRSGLRRFSSSSLPLS